METGSALTKHTHTQRQNRTHPHTHRESHTTKPWKVKTLVISILPVLAPQSSALLADKTRDAEEPAVGEEVVPSFP